MISRVNSQREGVRKNTINLFQFLNKGHQSFSIFLFNIPFLTFLEIISCSCTGNELTNVRLMGHEYITMKNDLNQNR